MTLDRRQFLARSGLGAMGAGSVGPGLLRAPEAQAHARDLLAADGPLELNPVASPAARLPAVPFHGEHQAGIVSAPPPAACFVACDVTAGNRGALGDLLLTLTARARFLTAGGVPRNLGTGSSPAVPILKVNVTAGRPSAAVLRPPARSGRCLADGRGGSVGF